MAEADGKGEPRPTGGRDRRPRRPSLTSEQVLDEAFRLFVEGGFERTSIDLITARLGIAKRTVYQRFGDKETLFRAALHRAIDRFVVPVERLRALETGDLRTTLLAVGQVLVDNVLSPAGMDLLRLTNAVSGTMPEMGAYSVETGTARTIDYLADLFRRRLPAGDGGYPRAREAAEAFLDLVVGGPANAAMWGSEWTRDAVVRRTRYGVHLFLSGAVADAGAAEGFQAGHAALEDENVRLKRLLADLTVQLDLVRNPNRTGQP